MRIISILILLMLSLNILVKQCSAQANPRHLEEIAFDFQRNKLLVFGGAEILPQGFTNPSGLFEHGEDGSKQVNGYGPVGRRGHALIYHHRDNVTYLFVGVTGTIKDSLLFDTWSWDGTTWIQLATQCPVKNPEGVFDPKSNAILIYGDASDRKRETYGDEQVFQLWQFKDNKWNMLSDSGPHPYGPYELSYDLKRIALIIPVWNNERLVVWEWVGNRWNQITCANECPQARNRFGLAYSSSEMMTYLFGGRDALNKNKFLADLWSWNGAQWKRIEPGNSPSARAGLAM